MNQCSLSSNTIHPLITYPPTYHAFTYASPYLSTYLPTHPFIHSPTYHRPNIKKITMCKKRLAIFIGEDDEKMLRFNINLTIGKHCNIISVNENLKS